MIITSKTIEWKEKIPRVIKGWVVKWQRALRTPFRDATALEAVLLIAPGIEKQRKQYKHG